MTASQRLNIWIAVTLTIGGSVLVCLFLRPFWRPWWDQSGPSKDWKAKVYLKGIAQAQRTYFEKNQTYATSFEDLGYMPDEQLDYVFVLAPTMRERTRDAFDGGQHSVLLLDRSALPWRRKSDAPGSLRAIPILISHPRYGSDPHPNPLPRERG